MLVDYCIVCALRKAEAMEILLGIPGLSETGEAEISLNSGDAATFSQEECVDVFDLAAGVSLDINRHMFGAARKNRITFCFDPDLGPEDMAIKIVGPGPKAEPWTKHAWRAKLN